MTSRERFLRTLADEPVDRPPLGGDGIREDVLEQWASEGHNVEAEFDAESFVTVQPNLVHSDFWLCDDRVADDDARLVADDPRRYPDDWSAQVGRFRDRDFPVGLSMSRGILLTLGVEDWRSLAPVLLTLGLDMPRVARTMVAAAEFTLSVLDRALSEVDFDYAILREPIASNAGPVIGPWSFRDACGEAYRLLIDGARSRGIEWMVFQSYGHATPLLEAALQMGLNVYWGGEVGLGRTDYHELRRRFGDELGLVGGIDAGLLERDVCEIEPELRRFVVPLMNSGRYLPMLDGRVRTGVEYERYSAYRLLLTKVVEEAASSKSIARSEAGP
jgi:hypothetical protein